MTTAGILWINIPLMVLAFAIITGVPLWMVIRRPDRDPRETRVAQANPMEARALRALRARRQRAAAPAETARELVHSR